VVEVFVVVCRERIKCVFLERRKSWMRMKRDRRYGSGVNVSTFIDIDYFP
jgi:hypothetical protein